MLITFRGYEIFLYKKKCIRQFIIAVCYTLNFGWTWRLIFVYSSLCFTFSGCSLFVKWNSLKKNEITVLFIAIFESAVSLFSYFKFAMRFAIYLFNVCLPLLVIYYKDHFLFTCYNFITVHSYNSQTLPTFRWNKKTFYPVFSHHKPFDIKTYHLFAYIFFRTKKRRENVLQ